MARATILVVDEEPVTRLTLSAVIEGAGYAPVQAADPAEALRTFHSRHVDAVLMDHTVLDDGKWLGSALKQARPEVPILVLSGNPSAKDAVAYADVLAAKPEHPTKLLQKLASLLQHRRQRRAA